jgi:hypothetical protein
MYLDVVIEKNKKKANKISVEILFGNLEQIINLGRSLLESLDKNENVISVFSKMIPFMKLYVVYVKNYENAVSLYSEKLKKDKDFQQIIKMGKQNIKSKGLDLGSLLSKPFQRIFSYKNIFDRLLELTPKNSVEFSNVNSLVKETAELVKFINEEKRQFENAQKINDLQKRISQTEILGAGTDDEVSNSLLKRWRIYIRTERIEISSIYTKNVKLWADCYLASDAFFYYVENMKVKSIPLCFIKLMDSDELNFTLDGFGEKVNLYFPSKEEKKIWKDAIYESIEKENQFTRINGVENPIQLLNDFEFCFKGIFERFESYKKEFEEFKIINQTISDLNEKNNAMKSKLNSSLNDIFNLQFERKNSFSELKKIKENERIKEINDKLNFFHSTFQHFRKICRNDEDEFKKLFGTDYTNFMKLKEKFQMENAKIELTNHEIASKILKKFNHDFLIFVRN